MLSRKQIFIIKKYNNYKDLVKNHPEIVYLIRKNNLKEYLPSPYKVQIPQDFWSNDLISKCANLCRTRLEFQKFFYGAYTAAVNRGILDEVMKNKLFGRENYTIYNLDKIKAMCDERRIISYYEFRQKLPGPHQQSYQQGWIECLKMFFMEKLVQKYSNLDQLAIKLKPKFPKIYNSKKDHELKELFKKYPEKLSYLKTAVENLLISELPCFDEMKEMCKEHGFAKTYKKYPIIRLLNKNQKFDLISVSNLNHFKKNKSGYNQPSYSKDMVIDEAKKYQTRKEFSLKSRGHYDYAHRNKILEEVCSHMQKPFESLGEQLTRKAFNYKYNKIFYKLRPEWLVNPKTGLCLELDGYNDELNIAFEVNGAHHYRTIHQDVELIKFKDNYKRQMCEKNNIKLHVFMYRRDLSGLIKQLNEVLNIPIEWLNSVALDLQDKLSMDEVVYYRQMINFKSVNEIEQVSYNEFAEILNSLRKQNLSNVKLLQVLGVTKSHLNHRINVIKKRNISIIQR